jgi:hypothetical protein
LPSAKTQAPTRSGLFHSGKLVIGAALIVSQDKRLYSLENDGLNFNLEKSGS